MQTPLQITFRGFPSSEAVTARIRLKVRKLEQQFGRITSCRVVIEAPHQHKHIGKTYRVSIDLAIPGWEILANRDAGRNHAHEDVYVAIRDAFDAVGRRLQDHVRRSQGVEKRHEATGLDRVR
jgi:ribosome-associated translation inhibitor RaiA